MIINQEINLADIFRLGRSYEYIRPDKCPQCGSSRIWGHGFVSRYFDDYDLCLYLKRWICAECGCVISIRPVNYFARHHCIILKIFSVLSERLNTGFWSRDPCIRRQRGGHWLRALKRNIQVFLGNEWAEKTITGFNQLITLSKCPVLRTA